MGIWIGLLVSLVWYVISVVMLCIFVSIGWDMFQ